MTLELYSIKDRLSGFNPPIPFIDKENAKRYFLSKCTEDKFFKLNIKDFSLWYMGIFDENSGIVASEPKLIIEGGEDGNEENNTIQNNTITA